MEKELMEDFREDFRETQKIMESIIMSESELSFLASKFGIPEEDYSSGLYSNPFRNKGVLKRELLRASILSFNFHRYLIRGYIVERNIKNEEIDREEIVDGKRYSRFYKIGIALRPPHYHYDWEGVVFWNLGKFQELLKKKKFYRNECLIIPEVGCLIFPKEIEILKNKKRIVARYWSGVYYWLKGEFLGYIVDKKGCLLQTFAAFSD